MNHKKRAREELFMPEPSTEKKAQPNVEPTLMDQIKANIADTVAYVILAFGLLYCFFNAFAAGILVGTILGVYFSANILQNIRQFKDAIIRDGIFKGFTLLAAICAFLITAPGMCIGLIVGMLARHLCGMLFPKLGE
jgi:hypothetical protein